MPEYQISLAGLRQGQVIRITEYPDLNIKFDSFIDNRCPAESMCLIADELKLILIINGVQVTLSDHDRKYHRVSTVVVGPVVYQLRGVSSTNNSINIEIAKINRETMAVSQRVLNTAALGSLPALAVVQPSTVGQNAGFPLNAMGLGSISAVEAAKISPSRIPMSTMVPSVNPNTGTGTVSPLRQMIGGMPAVNFAGVSPPANLLTMATPFPAPTTSPKRQEEAITLPLGKPYIVTKSENVTTGYSWSIVEARNLNTIFQSRWNTCDPRLTGCGGSISFVVVGKQRGPAVFRILHSQSWHKTEYDTEEVIRFNIV